VEYGAAASLGDWCPTFRNGVMVSPQNNGDLNFTGVKTQRLQKIAREHLFVE
jgi:hypothetical protein